MEADEGKRADGSHVGDTDQNGARGCEPGDAEPQRSSHTCAYRGRERPACPFECEETSGWMTSPV